MPNLNEFVKPEPPQDPQLQKIEGPKPCGECEKDSEFYFWNEKNMEMSWTCTDGHKTVHRLG